MAFMFANLSSFLFNHAANKLIAPHDCAMGIKTPLAARLANANSSLEVIFMLVHMHASKVFPLSSCWALQYHAWNCFSEPESHLLHICKEDQDQLSKNYRRKGKGRKDVAIDIAFEFS